MFGFVYIWRDRLTKRFYIGSHKGTPDDGYICSNPPMRNECLERPTDFSRRILGIVLTDRIELLALEQRWLNLIPKEEFGKKYYNRSASAKGRLLLNDAARSAAALKGVETKRRRGLILPPRTEEQRRHMSVIKTGKKTGPRSPEFCEALRQANLGKTHSEETKQLIAARVRDRFTDPEERRKQSERLTGRTLSQKHCESISAGLKGNPALAWALGSYWITDGIRDIRLLVGQSLPSGFRRGRCKMNRVDLSDEATVFG